MPFAPIFRWTAAIAAAALLAASAVRLSARAVAEVPAAAVDEVFAEWRTTTPGCAVGVSEAGEIALERAYGMADLEHDVVNTPDTIFEAGSVSKQFTAAAVLLLAREGRLSLDDPVGRYFPELPDYGTPITIRQMLQHTSGLRDWGSVAAIAGWRRTTRAHTHAHVLDIASRQRSLNFEPGTHWSYSNTGYNLAAILVARVSGTSFAAFTRQRIFEPLGMTRTSWRDDFTRIVRDRAVAYAEEPDGFHQDMPFENVHGNGGLLTTVGDLLRWNENFAHPTVGDGAFVREQQTPGRFSDGRTHGYALGLYVGHHKGVPQVAHSGSTAGYRAYLARYPDQRLSVAVLCNVGSAAAGDYAHAVADLYLREQLQERDGMDAVAVPSDALDARAGLYRQTLTGRPMRLTRDGSILRVDDDEPLMALSPSRFEASDGTTFEFGDAGLRLLHPNQDWETYEPTASATPSAGELGELAGTYTSSEAEVTLTVRVNDGQLIVERRPDTVFELKPVYADAFDSELGLVRFRRGADRTATSLSVSVDRVWDLHFDRVPDPAR